MVRGLKVFADHFADYQDSYALIGGAACDVLFGEAGLDFRATKDLDIVLCIEVVDAGFAERFQTFLDKGGYQTRQRSDGRREFYRFQKPTDEAYPAMLELFARKPEAWRPHPRALTHAATWEAGNKCSPGMTSNACSKNGLWKTTRSDASVMQIESHTGSSISTSAPSYGSITKNE